MGHLWVAKVHDQDPARSAMAVVRGLGHGGRARGLGEALVFGARGAAIQWPQIRNMYRRCKTYALVMRQNGSRVGRLGTRSRWVTYRRFRIGALVM